MVLVGTLGLRFVPAFYVDGVTLGWIDALFTATSAVCVTGLIVVDTATHFTRAGQAFILGLIQLGGLGMITITTLVILSLGRRVSLRLRSTVPGVEGAGPRMDPRRLTRDIILFTLGFEALGALVLFFGFWPEFEAREAAWHAVFQAVSAFCNAGFSTFSDSLEGHATAPAVLWTIMPLVVLGGIGFLTLEELAGRRRARAEGRQARLSLHSRIVLSSTAILLLGGWGAFALLEWNGVLGGMGTADRATNALFMSVTPRTAGFNTVPYDQVSDPANLLTMVLMFVGGSPGSTAGGLKTTTFFLIGLLAWCRIRGRTDVSIWARTVPPETVQRAVGVFAVAVAVIVSALLALSILGVEGGAGPSSGERSFLVLAFETTSAFNTVGLSMGATGELDGASRLIVTFLMFVGRIGPLAFAASLALRADRSSHRYRFAHEDVSIG